MRNSSDDDSSLFHSDDDDQQPTSNNTRPSNSTSNGTNRPSPSRDSDSDSDSPLSDVSDDSDSDSEEEAPRSRAAAPPQKQKQKISVKPQRKGSSPARGSSSSSAARNGRDGGRAAAAAASKKSAASRPAQSRSSSSRSATTTQSKKGSAVAAAARPASRASSRSSSRGSPAVRYADDYSESEDEEEDLMDEDGEQSSESDMDSDSDSSSSKRSSARRKKGRTPPSHHYASSSSSQNYSSSSLSKSKPVPYDSVIIPMGDKSSIEKLISYRTTPTEQILVKYKNMSYYHAEWVDVAEIVNTKMGKMRVKKFMEKGVFENQQWGDDEPFNPNFVKIDRVIDEGELHGEVYFLVKWCSQTYDLCTWESQKVVEELDVDKMHEFHQRRVLPSSKLAGAASAGKRPNRKEFRKLDESPVYKNGNTLRPYQLEGLNWLMYCWYNQQHSILADEMGLGKTVQSTVFLSQLYTHHSIRGPFLVITPLSTIGNWEREIKAWTDMNVVVYHGRDVARNLIVET
ncbi:hypothetical protein HK102_008120, partial [Quaeritorhiza haematococci]